MAINQTRLRLTDAQCDHLRAAAGHIERARLELEIESTDACGQCGRESAKNYTHFRLDQELSGVVSKLKKIVTTAEKAG